MVSLNHLPITGLGGSFDSQPPYFEGNRINLECSPGYKLPTRSSSVVVMKQDGTLGWDPETLDCIPENCGEPPIPDHGDVTHRRFVFPHWFSYVCQEGYRLQPTHPDKFYCGPLGNWMPAIPKNVRCDRIECPVLMAPVNGSVQVTDRYYGSEAIFRCHRPFVMVKGQERVVCQADGQWSGGGVVECGEMTCPELDPRVKLLFSSDRFKVVDCGNGKQVSLICLVTGQWSGAYPYCDQPIAVPVQPVVVPDQPEVVQPENVLDQPVEPIQRVVVPNQPIVVPNHPFEPVQQVEPIGNQPIEPVQPIAVPVQPVYPVAVPVQPGNVVPPKNVIASAPVQSKTLSRIPIQPKNPMRPTNVLKPNWILVFILLMIVSLFIWKLL